MPTPITPIHFVWAGPGPGPARTASWRRTRVRVRGVPVHGIWSNRSQSSSATGKRPTSPVWSYPVDGNAAYPEAPNLEITLAGEEGGLRLDRALMPPGLLFDLRQHLR